MPKDSKKSTSMPVRTRYRYRYRNKNRTIPVPAEIDRIVAERKLKAMGYETDELTEVQKEYLGSWEV